MTAVEALDILEAAVLECKKRDVGTPEPSASMFFPRRSMPRARSSPLRVPPARGSTADHSAHETFEGPALATSTNKALAARLEKNTADGAIAASMVIAQGLADVTVPPPATDAYVNERCAAGQRLEHWTFAGVITARSWAVYASVFLK
jgi:hypothetical protein